MNTAIIQSDCGALGSFPSKRPTEGSDSDKHIPRRKCRIKQLEKASLFAPVVQVYQTGTANYFNGFSHEEQVEGRRPDKYGL
jgi:hypothetical protein